MTISFEAIGNDLVLTYETRSGAGWVHENLETYESVRIKKTFEFEPEDLYEESEDDWDFDAEFYVRFRVARLEGEYFRFEPRVLKVAFTLFIHKSVPFSDRMFISERNVPIFPRVSDLNLESLYIGGKEPGAMPWSEYEKLLEAFPSSYEIRKYVIARVSSVLRNSVSTRKDGEAAYTKYLNRKLTTSERTELGVFTEGEILKYSSLLDKLEEMLDSETGYSESQWQNEIIQILLLIYPKYISVFKEAPLKDTYSGKDKRLDYLLVDSTGNTDLVEIKKPFDKCIVTTGKYRDNFIPLRDLSGTVMQVEKYAFLLNKWGKKGEEVLTKKYQAELPDGFEIKITNPGGIIIMGRDNNLSAEQLQDFEVIKRKYKIIIDILTYDDLLRRIRFTIEQLRKRS